MYLEVLPLYLQVLLYSLGPQVLKYIHDQGEGVALGSALGCGRPLPHIEPAVPEWLVYEVARVFREIQDLKIAFSLGQ